MQNQEHQVFIKNYIFNFLVSFFVYFAMYLLIVVIAQYAIQRYDVSTGVAGLITGIFIVGALIGRFVGGRYIHEVGPKRLLIIGLVLFIITQCFYFIEGSLIFLFVTRFLNGMALAIATTATGTIVPLIAPVERRGVAISLFSLSLVIGAAIGPFLGLYLAGIYPTFVLFTVCLVVAILAFVFALFLKVNVKMAEQQSDHQGFHISQFISVPAIPIALVVLICGLGYASVLSFLQLYAVEIDLTAAARYYFIFYAITSVFTRPFVGRILDRFHENWVAYPALVIFGVGILILAMAHSGWALLLSGALVGLGYGSMTAVGNVVAVKVSREDQVGLATSTFFIGLDVGVGFGPALLGMILPVIGYRMMYVAIGIILLLCIILYAFIHGRRQPKVMQ
ncbi:MFS transporter [Staphylococcus pseudintermedius]|uniref:MFS transporter n=1 Tax=Staphylococcus pseudintermedius TaxID=283734 RepID=UPI0018F57D45|nr:MFS transporter [Staphylococcus pseudintermedius]EGQ2872120.1 MFS transporter [Staphylococcus pseudintermedius]EGQ3309323.1 MFS transporter [Staphylococcus pseudintermedius]EGQ3410139.1 MFS transporter [Staphylococcus pseudintermedius]EGQ3417710.1 MFS transporter [Staphylococcus pseudintermedius]EGQ4163761.1 MFS transporter [Staphylococcus pseudintermedius]